MRRNRVIVFGASLPEWPEFPVSVTALHWLKRHYRLVIVSNMDRISCRSSNARLEVDFDAIFSAQHIESFKPNHRIFEYMLKRQHDDFRLERSDPLHAAQSLFHDRALANHFELASARTVTRMDEL
jgi:2-haloacid dehalogenase